MTTPAPDASAIPEAPAHPLDFLFHPRSIAIAGVSASLAGGLNGALYITSLTDIGFPGPIYLLHPTAPAIRGLRCYPRLQEIPGPVDYVICALGAERAPDLLEDCIEKGVRAMHIFSSGFGEAPGERGVTLQAKLAARAREAGIRLLGPNCMGLYVPGSRIANNGGQNPAPGNVGALSQSGANTYEIARFGDLHGVNFSKVVSFGNGADIRAPELFDYFASDPQTEVILAYLEDTSDGPALARAIRGAAHTKPVVILKTGKTEAGARAASSHTASLAGSAEIWDALCRQAPAVQVDTLEELVDVATAFRYVGLSCGPNVAVIGGGGGASVMATDALESAGMCVPRFAPETMQTLGEIAGTVGTIITNPADVISSGPDAFRGMLAAIARDPGIDMILYHRHFGRAVWNREGDASVREGMRQQISALAGVRKESGKPVAVTALPPINARGWEHAQEFFDAAWQAGLATFATAPAAAKALGRRQEWQRRREA